MKTKKTGKKAKKSAKRSLPKKTTRRRKSSDALHLVLLTYDEMGIVMSTLLDRVDQMCSGHLDGSEEMKEMEALAGRFITLRNNT